MVGVGVPDTSHTNVVGCPADVKTLGSTTSRAGAVRCECRQDVWLCPVGAGVLTEKTCSPVKFSPAYIQDWSYGCECRQEVCCIYSTLSVLTDLIVSSEREKERRKERGEGEVERDNWDSCWPLPIVKHLRMPTVFTLYLPFWFLFLVFGLPKLLLIKTVKKGNQNTGKILHNHLHVHTDI